MKRNYQLEMEREVAAIQRRGALPTLLLQSCCGPCSSAVLEYLTRYFLVTVFYYNPNIYPKSEYDKRLSEQLRLLEVMKFPNPVSVMEAPYNPEEFYEAVRGLEAEPEGGARCPRCFALRLGKTGAAARAGGFDYFTTTLSVSPHKDAQTLNAIGAEMGERYGVPYLFSDFKKKEGYKRSIQLARAFGLYRQDYCGCVYALRPVEK